MSKRKSGPKTAEGKAIVSTNATRHGLLSRRPIAIPGVEDLDAWQRHLTATQDDLKPVGYVECTLCDLFALSVWRSLRAAHAEAAIVAAQQARVYDSLADDEELEDSFDNGIDDEPEPPEHRQRRVDARRASHLLPDVEHLDAVSRHETSLHRSALKMLAALREMQRERRQIESQNNEGT